MRTRIHAPIGVMGTGTQPKSDGVPPHARSVGRIVTRRIGSYELIELLGSGGMGEVWRARHRLLGRDAAIKLVRPGRLDVGREEVVRAQFESEARTTAALDSPHTVRVFDFGRTNEGKPFYVMELLRGCDLENLVRRFGPLPCDRALSLLRQICHSLSEAHACGLVHGDIKPANLYTCRMGLDYDFAKVLDFGLAKPENHSLVSTLLTTEQLALGTPAYMAPEVISGLDADRRADVYALGCVAFFLLTGQLVFDAETPMKVLLQHVHAAPLPPSARCECPIPREIDDLVLTCLEKDPSRRPRDAEEVRRRIAGIARATWNQTSARRWWETHLPEYSAPLTSDCLSAYSWTNVVEQRGAQPMTRAIHGGTMRSDRGWHVETSIESHGSWMCRSSDALAGDPF